MTRPASREYASRTARFEETERIEAPPADEVMRDHALRADGAAVNGQPLSAPG